MNIEDLISAHLPDAVVAAVIITIYNVYTGNISNPLTIGIEFTFYVVVVFIGFVGITAIWNRFFGDDTT